MTDFVPLAPAPSPSSPLLEDQLCLDLYVASRTIIAAYRVQLAPFHLTYPQYLVMLALWQHGAQNVKELSERLVLDAGTLSPLLKRLEALEYIRRQRLARDARELQVSLTSTGTALQQEVRDVRNRVMCATGLTPDAMQLLQQSLRDMTAQLRTGANIDPQPQ